MFYLSCLSVTFNKNAEQSCDYANVGFFQSRSQGLPLPPPKSERRETRPWFGLVTCLPDFSRLQVNNLGEGQISVMFVATEPRGEWKVF